MNHDPSESETSADETPRLVNSPTFLLHHLRWSASNAVLFQPPKNSVSLNMFETVMEDYERKPIELRAIDSLGSGFDFASDFRLKFAKKCLNGERLVVLDEKNKRDIVIPGGGGGVIEGVSEDIRVDKGDRIRFKSDVLEFNQVICCKLMRLF
ncbi:unnamed protein product [Ilex paraguariensis]|uniref:Uncharacterized protein n=1 Tax=Ilex paraguariensis TaxID=185542 RepID=A0ABC8SZW0_9AQUA